MDEAPHKSWKSFLLKSKQNFKPLSREALVRTLWLASQGLSLFPEALLCICILPHWLSIIFAWILAPSYWWLTEGTSCQKRSALFHAQKGTSLVECKNMSEIFRVLDPILHPQKEFSFPLGLEGNSFGGVLEQSCNHQDFGCFCTPLKEISSSWKAALSTSPFWLQILNCLWGPTGWNLHNIK